MRGLSRVLRGGVIAATLLLLGWAVRPAGASSSVTPVSVSVSSTGAEGNNASLGPPSISADDRYIAFYSDASNLVPGDSNGVGDVFIRDVSAGTTGLVSRGGSGVQGNSSSFDPVLSADGRDVAFTSAASNLVPGDTNGTYDVFVRDVTTGRIQRASRGGGGEQANSDSGRSAISGDGRYVAFESGASNLVPGDANEALDIFLRDLRTGVIQLISRSSSGEQGNDSAFRPAISANGRYVAFESGASNLVPGDTNNTTDVFIRDLLTGRTRLVSRNSSGAQGNLGSLYASLSAGGRYLAFSSFATNLAPGATNGRSQVFVRDLSTGITRLVSCSDGGVEGSSNSGNPSISGDGRYVSFHTLSVLTPADNNHTYDVFVRDVPAGHTRLVSLSTTGAHVHLRSYFSSMSPDGRYVGFTSDATDLVPGDINNAADVFLRDLLG